MSANFIPPIDELEAQAAADLGIDAEGMAIQNATIPPIKKYETDALFDRIDLTNGKARGLTSATVLNYALRKDPKLAQLLDGAAQTGDFAPLDNYLAASADELRNIGTDDLVMQIKTIRDNLAAETQKRAAQATNANDAALGSIAAIKAGTWNAVVGSLVGVGELVTDAIQKVGIDAPTAPALSVASGVAAGLGSPRPEQTANPYRIFAQALGLEGVPEDDPAAAQIAGTLRKEIAAAHPRLIEFAGRASQYTSDHPWKQMAGGLPAYVALGVATGPVYRSAGLLGKIGAAGSKTAMLSDLAIASTINAAENYAMTPGDASTRRQSAFLGAVIGGSLGAAADVARYYGSTRRLPSPTAVAPEAHLTDVKEPWLGFQARVTDTAEINPLRVRVGTAIADTIQRFDREGVSVDDLDILNRMAQRNGLSGYEATLSSANVSDPAFRSLVERIHTAEGSAIAERISGTLRQAQAAKPWMVDEDLGLIGRKLFQIEHAAALRGVDLRIDTGFVDSLVETVSTGLLRAHPELKGKQTANLSGRIAVQLGAVKQSANVPLTGGARLTNKATRPTLRIALDLVADTLPGKLARTGMHEFSHAWLAVLKESDPESFTKLSTEVREIYARFTPVEALAQLDDPVRLGELFADLLGNYTALRETMPGTTKGFFGEMAAKYGGWVKDLLAKVEQWRNTYFKTGRAGGSLTPEAAVSATWSKELQQVADKYQRGDWDWLFSQLRARTESRVLRSVEQAASGADMLSPMRRDLIGESSFVQNFEGLDGPIVIPGKGVRLNLTNALRGTSLSATINALENQDSSLRAMQSQAASAQAIESLTTAVVESGKKTGIQTRFWDRVTPEMVRGVVAAQLTKAQSAADVIRNAVRVLAYHSTGAPRENIKGAAPLGVSRLEWAQGAAAIAGGHSNARRYLASLARSGVGWARRIMAERAAVPAASESLDRWVATSANEDAGRLWPTLANDSALSGEIGLPAVSSEELAFWLHNSGALHEAMVRAGIGDIAGFERVRDAEIGRLKANGPQLYGADGTSLRYVPTRQEQIVIAQLYERIAEALNKRAAMNGKPNGWSPSSVQVALRSMLGEQPRDLAAAVADISGTGEMDSLVRAAADEGAKSPPRPGSLETETFYMLDDPQDAMFRAAEQAQRTGQTEEVSRNLNRNAAAARGSAPENGPVEHMIADELGAPASPVARRQWMTGMRTAMRAFTTDRFARVHAMDTGAGSVLDNTAASRSYARHKAEQAYKLLTVDMTEQEIDLFVRFGMHERVAQLRARANDPSLVNVPELSPVELQRVAENQNVQAAIKRYKEIVQPDLERMRSVLGLRTKTATESGLFMSLVRYDSAIHGDNIKTTSNPADRFNIRKTRFRKQAHGTADAYVTDLKALLTTYYGVDMGAYNARRAIDYVKARGFARRVVPGVDLTGDFTIGGQSYKAAKITVRKPQWVEVMQQQMDGVTREQAIVTTPEEYFVPEPFAAGWNDLIGGTRLAPMREMFEHTPMKAWRVLGDKSTGLLLASFVEAYAHANRVWSVAKNVPSPRGITLGQKGKNLAELMVPYFGPRLGRLAEIVSVTESPDAPHLEDLMFRIGGGSLRAYAEAEPLFTKGKLGQISGEALHKGRGFLFDSPAKGSKGVWGWDIRARMVMLKLWIETAKQKGIIPADMTVKQMAESDLTKWDGEMRRFLTGIGNLNPENQPWIVAAMRESRLNPFAGSQSGFRPREIQNLAGVSGLPKKGYGWREAAEQGETMYRAWAGYATVLYLANYALSGHFPHDNQEGHIWDLDTGLKDSNGAPLYVSLNAADPALARASRTVGAKYLADSKYGETFGERASNAVGEKLGNEIFGAVAGGPPVQAASALLLGRAPYLSGGEMIRVTKPTLSATTDLMERLKATVARSNPNLEIALDDWTTHAVGIQDPKMWWLFDSTSFITGGLVRPGKPPLVAAGDLARRTNARRSDMRWFYVSQYAKTVDLEEKGRVLSQYLSEFSDAERSREKAEFMRIYMALGKATKRRATESQRIRLLMEN